MHKFSLPEFALERGRLMHPARPLVPARTAALAIDFQNFFIDDGQPMGNPYARGILAATNELHRALRGAGGTVIFTQHSMASPAQQSQLERHPTVEYSSHQLMPGSSSYELHSQLERLPGDITIVKHQSSPLHPKAASGLLKLLAERAIDTVIISGLVTNGCCDCTARDAFQHDFHVVMASDATAAMTDAEHNAALLNLAIYYARVMPVAEIIAGLK